MEAGLFSAHAAKWADALERVEHDIYHLPAYAVFAARHHHLGEPVAFIAAEGSARLLMPLILRPLPASLGASPLQRDAISPRNYPGPIAGPADAVDTDFLHRALETLPDVLCEAGVLTAFIRLHPLSDVPLDVLARHGEIVEHGTSVSVDLSASSAELWAQTRRDHKHGIQRAQRMGYRARIDEGWERFDEYLEAYAESMQRVGSDGFWKLDAEHFRDLRAALGGRAHLAVVELDGELAAGCLLTESSGIVDYHLAGTRSRHVRSSPSKVLIDFARTWAKDRGNRRLHLGGSLRPGDALNQFKLGFSPDQHVVATWRIIADAPSVDALVESLDARHGAGWDSTDDSFPVYRRTPRAPSLVAGPADSSPSALSPDSTEPEAMTDHARSVSGVTAVTL